MNDRELEALLAELPTPSLPPKTLLRLIRSADAARRSRSKWGHGPPWWAAAGISLVTGLLAASVTLLATDGRRPVPPSITDAPAPPDVESQRLESPMVAAAEPRIPLLGTRPGSILVYSPEFARSRSTLPDIPLEDDSEIPFRSPPRTEEMIQ